MQTMLPHTTTTKTRTKPMRPLEKEDVDYYTKGGVKYYYVELPDLRGAVQWLLKELPGCDNKIYEAFGVLLDGTERVLINGHEVEVRVPESLKEEGGDK